MSGSCAFNDLSEKAWLRYFDEVVNEFVSQLDVFGSRKGGIDIVVWFNLATFDIIPQKTLQMPRSQ
jgi:hypothetical protein